MSDIELDTLSGPTKPSVADEPDETKNTVSYWAYGAAIVLATFASCLALFPRVLLFLSESSTGSEARSSLTPLESFLAMHFGLWLFALAAALLLNTHSASPISAQSHSAVSSHPLLGSITVTSLFAAFISYNSSKVGALASLFFLGTLVIGLWGLWAVVFEGTANYSKKTGADKHTSSFLFKNQASASQQKKRWRKDLGLKK